MEYIGPVIKIDAAGAVTWGDGEGIDTWFPSFAVDHRYSQTKVVMRSVLLGDPGDTPEVGFMIAAGTAEAPARQTAPYPGAWIYGWPMDQLGKFIPTRQYASFPYYGRNVELGFAITETPTDTARGGAFVMAVCKHGEVATTQRAWLSNKGWMVFAGRGTREDGNVIYPWDPAPLPTEAKNAPGAHNYYNTEGWGNVSIIASDKSEAPAIAIRKYADTGKGLDFGYSWANNELILQSVASGVKKDIASFGQDGVKVGGGAGIKKILSATVQADFGAIQPHNYQSVDVTIAGASSVMMAFCGTVNATLSNASLSFDAWVMTTGVVRVYCRNNADFAIDPSQQTIRVVLLEF